MSIGFIYDRLFEFEGKNLSESYPIHKRLNFAGSTFDDWLLEQINIPDGSRVLDAGCGTGFTLKQISENSKITGLGLSLSKEEINFANRINTDPNLKFIEQSYDQPLDKIFDFIFCLESLKHSPELDHSLANLNTTLAPGGSLIIADDFVVRSDSWSQKQAELWDAPSFVKIGEMTAILQKLGDFTFRIYDLTDKVPVRATWKLLGMLRLFQFITLFNSDQNNRTYLGALILEYLYSKRNINYHLIVAKKQEL